MRFVRFFVDRHNKGRVVRHQFITMNVHLCLWHDWRDESHRAGSSATFSMYIVT